MLNWGQISKNEFLSLVGGGGGWGGGSPGKISCSGVNFTCSSLMFIISYRKFSQMQAVKCSFRSKCRKSYHVAIICSNRTLRSALKLLVSVVLPFATDLQTQT